MSEVVNVVYNAAAPALNDKQEVQLQSDSAGNLKIVTPSDVGAASSWSYAAPASGIVNTATAVTIKTAAGAGIRNYLKSLTLAHDVLGAVTEIAIRDGAGGTVLWRGKLQTPATEGQSFRFDPPLRGTANTLLEVLTLTAVTGGVFVNATGFTAA